MAWSDAEPVLKSTSKVDSIPRSSNEGDTMARSSTVMSSPSGEVRVATSGLLSTTNHYVMDDDTTSEDSSQDSDDSPLNDEASPVGTPTIPTIV